MISIPSTPLSDGARAVTQRLHSAGFAALWAGGCVRDLLLGREPKDYDIATIALPDQVERLFPGSVTVGKSFGVVRVPLNGLEYEVATFRKDRAYRDGRHPDGVEFTDEQTDAQRRDFTVNALFLDPLTGAIHDHVGGQADIEKKLIRAVGNPSDRFAEDHLRLIRAVRFAATLQFAIEPATAEAIRRHAAEIQKVSAERIQQELTRILLEAAQPGAAIELLQALGLLGSILPEIEAMRGQEQPPQFHPEGDVWTHTIMMLNAMRGGSGSLAVTPALPAENGDGAPRLPAIALATAGGQGASTEHPPVTGASPLADANHTGQTVNLDLRLAYAVLLHDVGKPGTAKMVDTRIRFDNHAGVGASLAETIMKRLRLPNDDIKAVAFCIANHMRFMDVRRMRKATLHRLVGAPTFPAELELHRLDCMASHGDIQNYKFLVEFQQECRNQPVLPKAWVTGRDILEMGIAAGPEVGLWKQRVYDAQLEGRVADRAAALAWLREQLAAGLKGS